MAGSRMTFIAEFVDRLTGPSRKASRAIEELGKASERAATASERAAAREERAAEKRARSTQRTTELAAAAAARRARTITATAKQEERATTTVENANRRQQRATTETVRVIGKSSKDTLNRLANQRTAWEQWRINTGQAARSVSRDTTSTARIIDQMVGRTTTGISSLSDVMGKVDPGRMASRYNTALNRMAGKTEQTASRMHGKLSGITDTDFARGAQLGTAAVGGAALVGGVQRINDVQQADLVMKVMGLDDKARADLTNQYRELALGTPYSTGSVANLGAGLLTSGMKQEDLQPALQGAIDTAAISGRSIDEMALPLKQIQAKGRLMGNDTIQLMDRNIPILDWIAKQKDVDRSQVQNLIEKGQVSSDDVFKALAANSKGGAELAGGTLKGSGTNFKSAISQAGEAFLTPNLGPITEFLRTGTDVVKAWQPVLRVLGGVTSVIVTALTPALPVLIPLITGVGVSLLLLGVATKVVAGVKLLAGGVQLLTQSFGGRGRSGASGAAGLLSEFLGGVRDGAREARGEQGIGGLNGALSDNERRTQRSARSTGLFGEFLGGIRDGAKEAYSERGLGGMDRGLDNSSKKMFRARDEAGRLTRSLGGIKGAAISAGKGLGLLGMAGIGGMALGALQGGSQATGDSPIANAATGGVEAVDQKFKDAKWANGNNGFWENLIGGSMKNVNGAGDVAGAVAGMNIFDKLASGAGEMVGIEDLYSSAKKDLSSLDSSLANMVRDGQSPQAGVQFNRIVLQAEASGASQTDIMGLFPEYKGSVYDVFRERKQAVDDNAVLTAMRSETGFRTGGFTGTGASTAPAGIVHRGEYVLTAEQTRRHGVNAIERFIYGGYQDGGLVGDANTAPPIGTIGGITASMNGPLGVIGVPGVLVEQHNPHERNNIPPRGIPMLPLPKDTQTPATPTVQQGDTISMDIKIDARGAEPGAAENIGQAVRDEVMRALDKRDRRTANAHGTRSMRGAR